MLIFSSLGYQTDTLRIGTISDDMHMGEIKMSPDFQEVSEVTVTANGIGTFASKDKIIIPSVIKDYVSSGSDVFDVKFYNNNNQFNVGYSLDYRNLYDYRIGDTRYQNRYRGINGLYACDCKGYVAD